MLLKFRALTAATFALSVVSLSLSGCGGGSGVSVAPKPVPTPTVYPGGTLAVTTLSDSGPGSLRAAILAVDALPGSTSSTIIFTITVQSGTITLLSDLPPITNMVKIDATQYYGTGPNIAINANGHAAFVFAAGSNNSQLLGVAVENASGNGVTLAASGITLNEDYIGLTPQGAPAGNSGDGVSISSTSLNNQIGVNANATSGVITNVISGNGGNGLSLHGSSGNSIVDNEIGTNVGGTAPIGNGSNGIWITAGSNQNEIGGTAFTDTATGAVNDPTGNKGTVTPVFVVPPLGNLVSGNHQTGILIDGGSANNTLNGNFVGTTANGNAAIGNTGDGVWINGASNNSLIGCQFVNNPFVYYNVLSGNGGNGLHITNANNITVQANFFGAGANNATIVANGGDGILVDGSSQNTQVGGVIPLGNVSAGNKKNGIEVTGTVSGFITFNTFGGLFAFQGAAPNGNDGVLITAGGGNQTVRTNVLSGNLNNGLEIGGNASGVNVNPDIIGLNTNGNAPLPNGNDGILLTGNAHNNTVGGYYVSVIPQNTFSGNGAYGLAITGGANNNQVFANFIGTNVLGTYALGNSLGGIYVGGSATNNIIGGTSTDPSMPTANLISGNSGNGVTLAAGSSYISVINNNIGLDRFGKALIPNKGLPIVVDPLSTNDTISGNITALGMGFNNLVPQIAR